MPGPNKAYYKPLQECPVCDGALAEAARTFMKKKKYVKIVYYCLDCGRRHVARSQRAVDVAPFKNA